MPADLFHARGGQLEKVTTTRSTPGQNKHASANVHQQLLLLPTVSYCRAGKLSSLEAVICLAVLHSLLQIYSIHQPLMFFPDRYKRK